MLSAIEKRGRVSFPAWTGERVYMRQFTKKSGLPRHLKRWDETVDQMLEGIDSDDKIFIMIDQSVVQAGTPHRRPGIHVDGVWNAESGWDNGGRWNGVGSHGGHVIGSEDRQGIVLASSVQGCAAYSGEIDGHPKDGGDCSHLDVSSLTRVELDPYVTYAGDSLTMLHESIPLPKTERRTLVRLNVQGWIPAFL